MIEVLGVNSTAETTDAAELLCIFSASLFTKVGVEKDVRDSQQTLGRRIFQHMRTSHYFKRIWGCEHLHDRRKFYLSRLVGKW